MADNDRKYAETELEAFFASARDTSPAPDPKFMRQLTDDMEAAMHAASAPRRPRPAVQGLAARLRSLFAASGLAGAAALGVWIGFVMPETLDGLTTGLDAADSNGIGAFLPFADLAALEE